MSEPALTPDDEIQPALPFSPDILAALKLYDDINNMFLSLGLQEKTLQGIIFPADVQYNPGEEPDTVMAALSGAMTRAILSLGENERSDPCTLFSGFHTNLLRAIPIMADRDLPARFVNMFLQGMERAYPNHMKVARYGLLYGLLLFDSANAKQNRNLAIDAVRSNDGGKSALEEVFSRVYSQYLLQERRDFQLSARQALWAQRAQQRRDNHNDENGGGGVVVTRYDSPH